MGGGGYLTVKGLLGTINWCDYNISSTVWYDAKAMLRPARGRYTMIGLIHTYTTAILVCLSSQTSP